MKKQMTNISSTPCGPLCIPIPNMPSHVNLPMQVEIFFTFHDRAAHDASVHPLAQVSQKPVVMPLAREEHGCIVYPSLCYKSSSVTMHCSACLIRCFADFASKETTQSHERRHAQTQFRYASSGPPMCLKHGPHFGGQMWTQNCANNVGTHCGCPHSSS